MTHSPEGKPLVRTTSRSDERGIALAVALFALVVIGAMVAGTFYIARLEQKTGDNTLYAAQAFGAAEAGADNVIATWNSFTYNSMVVGSSTGLATVSLGGGNFYTDTLTRLSNTVFLIRSAGERRLANATVLARRMIGRFLRLDVPAINIAAAVTTRGAITVSGSSQISGRDSIPVGWGSSCPPAGPTQPGIRDSSNSVTTTGACSGASCITGSPQILIDPTVTSATFTQFGSVSFSDLFNSATISVYGTITSVGPSITGIPPSCNTASTTNWGDPLNPLGLCFNYLPIVAAAGGTRITGGVGQGILLVNGDLEVSGGFEFYGPVVVTGTVTSTGTGGHFYGGLLAGNADFETSLLTGNSVVDYSSCTLQRALVGSAKAAPMAQRSWTQLF